MTPLYVEGIGLIAPGLASWSAAIPILTGAAPWAAVETELPPPIMLPKNERRRASATIRLALEAARQAVDASGLAPKDLPACFGSSSGDGDVVDMLVRTVTSAEGRVSPTLFHNSVHNAPAGYWSIATGTHAPTLSIGAFDATVAATLLSAAVHARQCATLVCVYDAALPEPLRTVRPVPLPFGAALVLSPTPSATSVARLTLRLGDGTQPPTRLQAPSLKPLHEGNPSARMLPLLEVLARRQPAEVVIPWQDCPALVIAVTPC
ncbi:MAG: beta-ketoacyl synthase chain length factor [Pseudomonadota bacterium]